MKRLVLVLMVCASPAWTAAAAPGKWELGVDKESAGLALSSANEMPLLECKIGKGVVSVTLHFKREIKVKADGSIKTPMVIASGTVTATVPAEAYLNGNYGGTDVAADIPAKAPVLAAFARTGLLKRTALGEASGDPPTPIAMAARFVRVCGG